MRLKLSLLFLLALIILGKFTYDQLKPPFSKGTAAPDFSLLDINGQTVSLSDFRGQTLLVHFWATWCPQCIEELPLLEEFTRSHPEIKVLAVNEDEDGEPAIKAFFRDKLPTFQILLDSEGQIADRYKSYKVPETFLLDKEGRFLYRFVGAVSWIDKKVSAMISKLTAGQE